MKAIILLLFVVNTSITQGTNYYLSTLSGDDNRTSLQAQNPSTPWRTINRLNFFNNLDPADSVLFKRGETFYGTLIINASGNIGNAIIYGAYGIGTNPVISGQTELTSWIPQTGNIYYTALDVPILHVVTYDDYVKGMGRHPNSGYLKYESHLANTSITDNELAATPDWSGGELVIRKYRWIIDRHRISAHSTTTLTYTATSPYGNNNGYDPVDGNGYFIQGHLSTLDVEGEWYYDNAAKRLYMHFGAKTPSGTVVKVGTVDRLVSLNSQSYITFNDIDFEGGNYGGYLQGATNIAFNTCNFTKQGSSSLYAISSSYVTINGGSIRDALNNGIFGEFATNNFNVDGLKVSRIGTIAGLGRSGDASGIGIFVAGNNVTIKNCTIKNTGYNGIQFGGDDVLVEKNLVDTFCTLKDDGGGIYTVNRSTDVKRNRIIQNNIVINAIGAFAGAESYYYEAYGKAAGIYLDDFSNITTVTNNVVANGEWAGIFLHNGYNNTVTNNLVYNFGGEQLYIIEYAAGTVTGLRVTGNTFIAKSPTQKCLHVRMHQNNNPSLLGIIDENYYARPIDNNITITVDRQYLGGGSSNITLPTWQSTYNLDGRSSRSFVPAAQLSDISFHYNNSDFPKTMLLNENYMDVYGTIHSGRISISPHFGIVLIHGNFQVLPLESLHLTGKLIDKKIHLNWSAIQKNTRYFEIQKSSDSLSFRTLGKVKRDNFQFSNYSFQDDNPLEGKSLYRLKIVNFDSSFYYSKILSFFGTKKFHIKVFPNPGKDKIHVIVPGAGHNQKIKLSISTVSGINVKTMNGEYISTGIPVDISFLSPGVYTMTIMFGDFQFCNEFIKQ